MIRTLGFAVGLALISMGCSDFGRSDADAESGTDRTVVASSQYPIAIDPSRVGEYPALVKSGAGYFYDEVLEYGRFIKGEQDPITMKIEGIKGCFEKTSGLFYFARMCSKIRLHAKGRLPGDYHEMLGQGFDGRTCRYLRVRYEDVRAEVLSGKPDTEVLEWCFAEGRRLTEEEVLIYNSFMSKRGWHDDETDGFIPEMIKQYGLKDDGSVLTDFDLIEMDEGRWYPDMWRDAWK